ncbi:MAG: hypothetical protein AAGB19_01180 [Cyanobacteria bacterium P01_F01_bin.3]
MVSSKLLEMRGFIKGTLQPLGTEVVFVPDASSDRYFVPGHLIDAEIDWPAVLDGACEISAWARVCDYISAAPEHLHEHLSGSVETTGFQWDVFWTEDSQRVAGSSDDNLPPYNPDLPPFDSRNYTARANGGQADDFPSEESADIPPYDPGDYKTRTSKRRVDGGGEYWDIPARSVDEWVQENAHLAYLQAFYAQAALLGEAAAEPPMLENPVQRHFNELAAHQRSRDAERDTEMFAMMTGLNEIQDAVEEALKTAQENNWAVNVLLSTEAQTRKLQAIKWGVTTLTGLVLLSLALQPVMTGGVALRDAWVDTSVWLEDIDRWLPFDWPREPGR